MLKSSYLAPVAGVVLALIVGFGTEEVVRLEKIRAEHEQREQVASKVAEYRAALEGELNATLYLTNGLVAYVAEHTRLEPRVADAILKSLYGQARHVRNLGLAPGNRLSYVYPLAGNEKAIGIYYPDIPDQWPVIERAIREQRSNLAGPVALKQGGSGFIYRVPVFVGPRSEYWGLLSMVVDRDSLFRFVGIRPSQGGLSIAIRGRDGRGPDGDVILGNAALFSEDTVKAIVNLPGGTWQIAARPERGWTAGSRPTFVRVSGWTLAAVLGVLLYVALLSALRRLEAEDAVRQSRNELSEAQRIAGLGSWVLDLKTNQLNWSDETCRIFAIPPGETVSLETFGSRIHPDDRMCVLDAWAAAVAGESEYDIEHRIVVDGGEKWVHERAQITRSPDGQALQGIGTVLDITVRKRAEIERNRIYETLRRSEARLKEAHRIAQLGDWNLDFDRRSMSISDEVAKILGLGDASKEIPYDEYLKLVHPEDRQRVQGIFEDAVSSGSPLEAVYRLETADGGTKYVRHRSQTVQGDDDPSIRLVGTLQDVTMERLNEEALKESEERFRTVADHNYDWEYWRDPGGAYLYLSPSCQRITGYAQHEFIADPALTERIVHQDDRQRVLRHVRDVHAADNHTLDFRIVRKDGLIRWIAHGCRPVFGADGAFRGRRVSNRDITDRKHTEAALMEAKNCLALALDATQLSIWDLDVEARSFLFDERWATLVGMPPGARASTVDELASNVHPGDLKHIAEAADAALAGRSPRFEQEFRYRMASGEWKWLHASGTILERNAQGQPLRAIGTTMDITERKRAEEAIRRMAFHDRLTRLPNRRLLEDRLRQVIAHAQRDRRGLAVLFIDLDKFKPINDRHGHHIGDWLLQRVAERMQSCLRDSDTVARIGGDEFVVVLPEADKAADAVGVAEKIRVALLSPFEAPGDAQIDISCSIGIALYPEHAENLRDLLRCGDEAMYRAKKAGSNAVAVFSNPA